MQRAPGKIDDWNDLLHERNQDLVDRGLKEGGREGGRRGGRKGIFFKGPLED
jgi:hypothetical protein